MYCPTTSTEISSKRLRFGTYYCFGLARVHCDQSAYSLAIARGQVLLHSAGKMPLHVSLDIVQLVEACISAIAHRPISSCSIVKQEALVTWHVGIESTDVSERNVIDVRDNGRNGFP